MGKCVILCGKICRRLKIPPHGGHPCLLLVVNCWSPQRTFTARVANQDLAAVGINQLRLLSQPTEYFVLPAKASICSKMRDAYEKFLTIPRF